MKQPRKRGDQMDSLFEDLREGLQQAIDYERGNGPAKKVTYVI